MKSIARQEKPLQSWLRSLGTLLSIGVLLYLLASQGWQEIGKALGELSLWRLVFALMLMFGSRLAVTLRWHVLLRSAKVPIPFIHTLRLTFGGLFASNVLPTTIGGDVFRLAGAVQSKMEAPTVTASLLADRLIGMAGMAMALPFGISALTALRQGPLVALSPTLSASFGGGVNLCYRLFEKGVHFLRRTLQAMSIWRNQPQALLISLGWTWVHMLCLFSSLAVLFDGLGEPLPLGKIAGLWSLVYFVTLIPISINGYGLQEVSLTVIFTTSGGVSQATALAVALLIRLLTLSASLPGAFFVPTILSGEASLAERGDSLKS